MTHIYNDSRIPEDQRIDDPLEYLSYMGKRILPLEKWGMKKSAQIFNKSPEIVYSSESCKVLIHLNSWDYIQGFSLYIFYGRLHAKNDGATMIWNGEKCHCWHSKTGIGRILDFLDGISPVESLKPDHTPEIFIKIRNEDWWKDNSTQSQNIERSLLAEAEIWEYYGYRLFNLFDLKHPDLWEKYQNYMTQIYDIKGRSKIIKPPLDKIC